MSHKQPKVTTNNRNKQEKINKIMQALKNHPEGLTPKAISYYTGINHNTIKSMLPDMDGVKHKGYAGLYVLVDNDRHGAIFKWNFHNAILSYKLPKYNGQRITKNLGNSLLNLKFEIGSTSKKASLRVSTQYPLNITSIYTCYLLFCELIHNFCNEEPVPSRVYLTSIEINNDMEGIKLDGLNSISIDSLSEQFKLYHNKSAKSLRSEHKLKLPIKLEAIFNMLINEDRFLELYDETIKHKHNEELILKYQSMNSKLLQEILKKLDVSKINRRNL
nr:hypothetical protein [Candidatus Woesearchaeota archaeon]